MSFATTSDFNWKINSNKFRTLCVIMLKCYVEIVSKQINVFIKLSKSVTVSKFIYRSSKCTDLVQTKSKFSRREAQDESCWFESMSVVGPAVRWNWKGGKTALNDQKPWYSSVPLVRNVNFGDYIRSRLSCNEIHFQMHLPTTFFDEYYVKRVSSIKL